MLRPKWREGDIHVGGIVVAVVCHGRGKEGIHMGCGQAQGKES